MTEPSRPVWQHLYHGARTLFILAGATGVVVVSIAAATALSGLADWGRSRKAEQQGPAVVAREAAHQPSAAEIAAELRKVGWKGEIRIAPKPGTKKGGRRGGGSAKDGSQSAGGTSGGDSQSATRPDRNSLPPDGDRSSSSRGDMSDEPVTTAYPAQEIKASECRWGCTALPTLTGKPDEEPAFHALVSPSPRPRFQLGGQRRAGGWWDPIGHTGGLFYEQDLFSLRACNAIAHPGCGRGLVVGVRPFASYDYQALPGARAANYGVPVTLAVEWP